MRCRMTVYSIALILALGVVYLTNMRAPSSEARTTTASSSKHPRLFFTSADIPKLREKGKTGYGKDIRDLLLFTADWAMRAEIYKQPAVLAQKTNPDGTYNPDGVLSAKKYWQAGAGMESIVTVLALSYHVSGEKKYADRAIEWLNEYCTWSKFILGDTEADIINAHPTIGLIIGYDMLYKELSAEEREKTLDVILREVRKFDKRVSGLSEKPLAEYRQQLGNNHNIIPAVAAGLGGLLLKMEGKDDGTILANAVNAFRKCILPSAFSVEGEYVDGTDQWLPYVLDFMTIFFEALRRNGGPNFWQEGAYPPMQRFWERVIEFWLQWDSILSDSIPRTYPTEQRYRYRFPLLAIASQYRNPEYQYLALKDHFKIYGEDVSDYLGFDQRKATEDEKGKILRWFASPWEYLFYDDTLKPSEMKPRETSVCFPNLGRAIIRSTWNENPSALYFRAGPRIGKDHGDNNAFQLTAFGYKILPPLDMPEFPLKIRGVETMKEQDWRQSTFGNNTIVVDGVRQHSQWALSQKRFISQKNAFGWLARPEENAEPQARMVSYAFSPLVDYVCGDAGNAYYTDADERMLKHFKRHIFFIKTEYLVVYDDIASADDTPRKIEWYYHAGSKNNVLDVKGNNRFVISPADSSARIKLDTTIVFPEVSIEKKQAPSIMKRYDSDYVVFKEAQAKPRIACLCVMDIHKDDSAPRTITLVSNNAQCLILSIGKDTLIINKTDEPISYNAMKFSGAAMWSRPGAYALLINGLYLKQSGKELIRNQKRSSAFWKK